MAKKCNQITSPRNYMTVLKCDNVGIIFWNELAPFGKLCMENIVSAHS